MIPIAIQVSRSRSKVLYILYMLGKGGISVLQTSIFKNWHQGKSPCNFNHKLFFRGRYSVLGCCGGHQYFTNTCCFLFVTESSCDSYWKLWILSSVFHEHILFSLWYRIIMRQLLEAVDFIISISPTHLVFSLIQNHHAAVAGSCRFDLVFSLIQNHHATAAGSCRFYLVFSLIQNHHATATGSCRFYLVFSLIQNHHATATGSCRFDLVFSLIQNHHAAAGSCGFDLVFSLIQNHHATAAGSCRFYLVFSLIQNHHATGSCRFYLVFSLIQNHHATWKL